VLPRGQLEGHSADRHRKTRIKDVLAKNSGGAQVLLSQHGYVMDDSDRLRRAWQSLPTSLCILAGAALSGAIAASRLAGPAAAERPFARAVLIGAALTCGAVMAVRLRRARARPLAAAAAALRGLARGDVHIDIPATWRKGDLAELASALEVFRGHLFDRRAAEAALLRTNAVFATALNCMMQGMIVWSPANTVQFVNRRYFDVHDLPPGCVVPGMTLRAVVKVHRANGVHPGETEEQAYRKLHGFINAGVPAQKELEVRSGVISQIALEPTPGGGCVVTFEDVTEKRLKVQRITHLARHDALTGLANRASFNGRISKLVAEPARHSPLAVLCLDLDRFKVVNDTLGHGIGDDLLRNVADRLRACMRVDDLVARLGGDEFAVLMPGGDRSSACTLAERIVQRIGAPYDVAGHRLVVGVSVGIALGDVDQTPECLLNQADVALYEAKEKRGTWRVFEAGMDSHRLERKAQEAALVAAVSHRDFELQYQPQLDLTDNAIGGVEVLVHWRRPDGSLVPTADFLTLAEQTGLIVPIGEWVLGTACAEAAAWPGHARLAVRLSVAQFKSRRLVDAIEEALVASGLAPERLELEIPEAALLQDTEAVLSSLRRLHSLGARIVMDDFGTGYSSLGYLSHFRFDKIKIGGSFACAIDESTESASGASAAAVVDAIASYAASLGIVTAAGGIDTAVQLDRARTKGCTEAQGPFISPPRPASDIPALLNRRAVVASLGGGVSWLPCQSIAADELMGR
jgi:diguanylate cyclase (GGDEF)-like protein